MQSLFNVWSFFIMIFVNIFIVSVLIINHINFELKNIQNEFSKVQQNGIRALKIYFAIPQKKIENGVGFKKNIFKLTLTH